MKRKLKYSADSLGILSKNSAHNFAVSHALNVYPSRSVYTYIPKNACSTMRYSLAIENGCIGGEDDVEWIHDNNTTFTCDLRDILTASYTFTILRCPFKRLASLYLDKFLSKDRVAWHYFDANEKRISLDSLTFKKFVRSLRNQKVLKANHHWRPQVDFLLYEEYDDYFDMEKFTDVVTKLKQKIDFSVQDARELIKHGTEQYEFTSDFSGTKQVLPLSRLKNKGIIPSHEALYDEETIELVLSIFSDDIALYNEISSVGALF